MFNEKFVVGIAYRWSAAARHGISSIWSLYLGYGYDLETTNLDNYNLAHMKFYATNYLK
jgi:hypothetical protein